MTTNFWTWNRKGRGLSLPKPNQCFQVLLPHKTSNMFTDHISWYCWVQPELLSVFMIYFCVLIYGCSVPRWEGARTRVTPPAPETDNPTPDLKRWCGQNETQTSQRQNQNLHQPQGKRCCTTWSSNLTEGPGVQADRQQKATGAFAKGQEGPEQYDWTGQCATDARQRQTGRSRDAASQ